MPPGPFELHLREAIALNRDRLPRYAARSDGASLPVSRTLIRSERLLLPLARRVDRRAARYHDAGIPLLHDLFVSMENTPPFGSSEPVDLPAAYHPPQARPLSRAISGAYRADGYAGALPVIARALDDLTAHPEVDAMLRHLLESMRRLATVAPRHAEQARALGLPSPHRLLGLLFRAHLGGFGFAARLDRRARPLQVRGIPIIARDVPPIPAEPA